MSDVEKKEFSSRREEIRDQLQSLYDLNMKITVWDVPEVDDQESAQILIDILQEKLDEIKADIKRVKD